MYFSPLCCAELTKGRNPIGHLRRKQVPLLLDCFTITNADLQFVTQCVQWQITVQQKLENWKNYIFTHLVVFFLKCTISESLF